MASFENHVEIVGCEQALDAIFRDMLDLLTKSDVRFRAIGIARLLSQAAVLSEGFDYRPTLVFERIARPYAATIIGEMKTNTRPNIEAQGGPHA